MASAKDDGQVRRTAACFPHAGAGATAFAPWQRHLPDWLELHAHGPPGREERAGERPLGSVEELIADVMPELATLSDPLVLIGHSFGAYVAFELAHVALAARPPGLADWLPVHDDADIESLWIRLGASPEGLVRPEFRRLVFPALRADLGAHAAYRPPRRTPLRVPVTVLYGEEDAVVNGDGASAWQALCAERCHVAAIPGGHFFPRTSARETVCSLVQALAE